MNAAYRSAVKRSQRTSAPTCSRPTIRRSSLPAKAFSADRSATGCICPQSRDDPNQVITRGDLKPIVIEPLDSAKHGRAAFACGIDKVDNFFRSTANKLTKAGYVRIFVMVSLNAELIGFYAINAHAMDYAELPVQFARNRHAYGSIPVAYIIMIGADSHSQE